MESMDHRYLATLAGDGHPRQQGNRSHTPTSTAPRTARILDEAGTALAPTEARRSWSNTTGNAVAYGVTSPPGVAVQFRWSNVAKRAWT